MLTNLGKELRKLRLDLGITLYDMANEIGVSTSLLSAVETGKRPATAALMDKLAGSYDEIAADRKKFDRLAAETLAEVRVRLGTNDEPRADELALAFARKFDSLSTTEIDSMLAIFRKKDTD